MKDIIIHVSINMWMDGGELTVGEDDGFWTKSTGDLRIGNLEEIINHWFDELNENIKDFNLNYAKVHIREEETTYSFDAIEIQLYKMHNGNNITVNDIVNHKYKAVS